MLGHHDVCPHAMCIFLPIGFILLAFDSYHDLRWCLQPSKTTANQLKWYYSTILTPRIAPIPCPGFLFPIYVIYFFLNVCPDWIGWSMFALYIPLCERYYRIICLEKKRRERGGGDEEEDSNNDCLEGWWLVVGIRVGLAALTHQGIVERGCNIEEYSDDFGRFWEIQFPFLQVE
jgi:hypothetical protein